MGVLKEYTDKISFAFYNINYSIDDNFKGWAKVVLFRFSFPFTFLHHITLD